MLSEAKQAYTATKDWHEDMIVRMQDLRNKVSKMADMKELTDAAYAFREIAKLADDIRKDGNNAIEQMARAVGVLFVKECLIDNDLVLRGKIDTPYCSGTPDVGTMVKLPSRRDDPKAYGEIMRFLGVPDELIGGARDDSGEDLKPISVNWDGMILYLTQLMREGKQIPACFDPTKTYPVYKLGIRKKKEVDADL